MKRVFILGAAILAAFVPLSVSPAQADSASLVVEGCAVTVPTGAGGFAVLDAAISSGCLTIHSYEQAGGFLNCVNGVCGQTVLNSPTWVGTYWAVYVNGQYSNFGLGDYSAANGDVLVLTYEYLSPFWFLP